MSDFRAGDYYDGREPFSRDWVAKNAAIRGFFGPEKFWVDAVLVTNKIYDVLGLEAIWMIH